MYENINSKKNKLRDKFKSRNKIFLKTYTNFTTTYIGNNEGEKERDLDYKAKPTSSVYKI